jgi:hypothetical protein
LEQVLHFRLPETSNKSSHCLPQAGHRKNQRTTAPHFLGTIEVRMGWRTPTKQLLSTVGGEVAKDIPDIERFKLLYQEVMLLRPFPFSKSQTVHTLSNLAQPSPMATLRKPL